MLRMLGAAQKREVKAAQNLSIIVLFFMICWIPLYTINCVQAFCHHCNIPIELTNFAIILSHLNSAVNPLLYAYHLRDFRAALKRLILNIFGIKETEVAANERNGRPSINSNYSQCRRSRLNTKPPPDSLIYRKQLGVEKICLPIVSNTTALAVASLGAPKRDIWTIAEVPSAPGGASRSASVASTARLNSGYKDQLMHDLNLGEDEVFYADNECPIANECDSSEVWRRLEAGRGSEGGRIWCLSSSSPQLARSVFVVGDSGGDRRRANLSVPGEFSPADSRKSSPAKVVGEFLTRHNSNDSYNASKTQE